MKKLGKLLFFAAMAALLTCLLCVALNATQYSGNCGSNVKWKFDEYSGILSIDGTGQMYNYSIDSNGQSNAPWYSFRVKIKEINVGRGVTSIGNYAFYHCTYLWCVDLPSSVTSIGDCAFSHCLSLYGLAPMTENLKSLKSIGKGAFSFCENITAVYIPSSVTDIGDGYPVFEGCEKINKITVESGNKKYYSVNSCIIEKSTKKLIAGCRNSVIPTNESITTIGKYAFSYQEYLTQISIPASVTVIEERAFFHSGLKRLSFEKDSKLEKIGKSAFGSCNINDVMIPSSVKYIEDYAFSSCRNLWSITIPDNVLSIGKGAFQLSLNNITILSRTVKIYSSDDTISSSTTIYGYLNSTAAAYARQYRRNFREIACNHKRESAYQFDSTNHWYKCKECEKTITEKHVFDNSCDAYCNKCGYSRTITHNYKYKSDSNNHWLECTICHKTKDSSIHNFIRKYNSTSHWLECSCGLKKDSISHIFDGVCDTKCDDCGYTRTVSHSYSSERKYDETHHWYECTICQNKKSVATHSLSRKNDDTTHWLECSCGYKKEVTEHTFEQKYSSTSHWDECSCGYKKNQADHDFELKTDDSYHWFECSCGYKKNMYYHSFSRKSDEDNHWNECACGYKKEVTAHDFEQKNDSTNHWLECSVCGKKADIVEHSFEQQHNETTHWSECACGYKKGTATHKFTRNHDEKAHWFECSCGEKKDIVAHIFDNSCDTTCDTCGYVRTITHSYEQKHNDTNHWLECSVCHEKKDEAAHTFRQRFDKTHHWNECSCGFIKDKSEHTLDEEGKCTECRFGRVMLGDLNGDGKISAIDLTLMRKYIAGYKVDMIEAAADLNGDGRITAVDLTMLRKYIAGLITEF